MTASCPPLIKFQPLIAGRTLPGGQLLSYIAGTSTPLATYASDGTTPNTNPLILDADGCAEFRLGGAQAYKFNLLDADNVQLDGWPVDNITNPLLELASQSDPSKGAGQVGFSASLAYPDGSVGAYVKGLLADITDDTSASKGAGMVAYGGGLEYPADTIGGVAQKLVTQLYTNWSTSGTAPAYELAPSPELSALSTGTRFRITVHGVGVDDTAPTLAVSDLDAKSIKQFAPDGSKTAPTLATGAIFDVEYDGTDWVILNPLPGPSGSNRNLKISTTGASASVTITASQAPVRDAHGTVRLLSSVAQTIDMTTTGEDGLDTGTAIVSTWYSLWIAYNSSTGETCALASLSASSPTLPTGYDFKARVGWVRTDATNAYPLACFQRGNRFRFKTTTAGNLTTLPLLASGAAGTASGTIDEDDIAWAAVSLANYVPSTASAACVQVYAAERGVNNLNFAVAPNGNYKYGNDAPLARYGNQYQSLDIIATDILLETDTIYWYMSHSSGRMALAGWVDEL